MRLILFPQIILHIFYTNRFMKNVSKYIVFEKSKLFTVNISIAVNDREKIRNICHVFDKEFNLPE